MIITHHSRLKCQTFAGYSFLNVRICYSHFSFMTVNEQSLVFGLLAGKKQQDVNWDSGNFDEPFSKTFFDIFIDSMIKCQVCGI